MDLADTKLAQDRAIVAIRSRERDPHTSFQLLRTFDPSVSTHRIAELSLEVATSQRVGSYENGIFVSLLKSGGFFFLETDSESGKALALHLVTSPDGARDIIHSQRIIGSVDPSVAKELAQKTADLVADLVSSKSAEYAHLEDKFYISDSLGSDESQDVSFFAIPRKLKGMSPLSDDARELAALVGAYRLWPLRYALSMPIYAANPNSALQLARQKQKDIVAQSLQAENKSPETLYDLQDLDSIETAQELAERVTSFRRLNHFLDQSAIFSNTSETFSVNREISSVAMQLGVTGHGGKDVYAVMTTPGLVVVWRRLETRRFVATGMYFAE